MFYNVGKPKKEKEKKMTEKAPCKGCLLEFRVAGLMGGKLNWEAS